MIYVGVSLTCKGGLCKLMQNFLCKMYIHDKNTFKKFSVASRIQKSMKMLWYICQPFTAQRYISCYFVYITPSENTMVLNIPYHMSFPPLSGQTSSLVA